jgi:hypothetical protein
MTKDKFKLRPKQKLVIALDDLDFTWLPSEIALVKTMWDFDYHIADIAAKVKRDQDEVAVLIMHLARKEKIAKRKTGVLGH